MDIQWYPGHMARARRQIADKLKIIDVVIDVRDARAPKSTGNPDFADMFRGKAVLTVLNKADLALGEATREWVGALDGGTLAFSCLSSRPGVIISALSDVCAPIVERYKAKGMNKTVRAIVAGVPNVGKSAILNRLGGARSVKEGDKPGVTRGLQWVRISPYLELMDSPGMLYPKIDDERTAIKIAALNCIREEIIDISELSLSLISLLAECAPGALFARFGVPEDASPLEIFEGVCKRRGCLMRGGEYDYERCAKIILDDFRSGRMGEITLERP